MSSPSREQARTRMLFEGSASGPTRAKSPEFLAVVLCGLGQDLFPLTGVGASSAKATLPVANRPLVDYVLSWAEESGLSSSSFSLFCSRRSAERRCRGAGAGARGPKGSARVGPQVEEDRRKGPDPDRPRVPRRRRISRTRDCGYAALGGSKRSHPRPCPVRPLSSKADELADFVCRPPLRPLLRDGADGGEEVALETARPTSGRPEPDHQPVLRTGRDRPRPKRRRASSSPRKLAG